jgi:hypothetical protein
MESISAVTVTDKELDNHLQAATAKMFGFSYKPTGAKAQGASPATGGSATLGGRSFTYRPLQGVDGSTVPAAAPTAKFSIMEVIRDLDPKDDLYSDVEHLVIRQLRRSIQIFLQIYEYYERSSGLERLKQANKANQLAKDQEIELKKKGETACAVSLFAMAHFADVRLSGTLTTEVEALTLEVPAPDAVLMDNQANAIHSTLYYLFSNIKELARDDATLVKVVADSCQKLAERIAATRESLGYLDFYTRYTYRIDPDAVTISGFDAAPTAVNTVVEVQTKRPQEVVGNHIAKFEAMRLAQRLVCYDPVRQRNPFVDLGGFSFTFIGDGSPGTGKTTLIQMMVTQLRDYCAALSLPLRYLNFSVDEISDYQGRSGQNAKRFCKSLLDPTVLGFGTIDDVDQVCGNRNDKNASAGQLEVTAVFMSEFAGPNTVIRGNTTFGLFSNYPEKVDDALRQRTQARFLVNGPQTLEDFTDLFHLLLGQNWEMATGKGYTPYETQQIREIIQAKYEEHNRPQATAISKIFDGAAKSGKISTWIEFGNYLHALQKHDERFTGRAVRNIAEAVKFRMMDFDLPQEWFENPEAFFAKPYDTKVEILKALRGKITPEIVLQEINRYADSEDRYASIARDRELSDRTRQVVLDARARIAASKESLE